MDLTNIYHDLFDIKEANYDNETIRMKAYAACAAVANLMQALGQEVPERFDGEGRPAGYFLVETVDGDFVRVAF